MLSSAMKRSWDPVRLGVALLAMSVLAGCSSGAGAILDTLLAAPVPTASPGTEPGPADSTASPSAVRHGVWFSHRDGYAMQLPPGWVAAAVDPADMELALGAIGLTDPGLAPLVRDFLETNSLRVSMLAADLSLGAEVPPLIVVLSQPSRGMRAGQVAARAGEAIARLPLLTGSVTRSEEALPTGDFVRFDFRLEHAVTGPLLVRCHVMRFGGSAFLVALAAPPPLFESASSSFALILQSLRFGV